MGQQGRVDKEQTMKMNGFEAGKVYRLVVEVRQEGGDAGRTVRVSPSLFCRSMVVNRGADDVIL